MEAYVMSTKYSNNIYFLKEELGKDELGALSQYEKTLEGRHITITHERPDERADFYCLDPETAELFPEEFKETRCIEEIRYFVLCGGLSPMYEALRECHPTTDKRVAEHLEKSGIIGVTQAIYIRSVPTEIEVVNGFLKRIWFRVR